MDDEQIKIERERMQATAEHEHMKATAERVVSVLNSLNDIEDRGNALQVVANVTGAMIAMATKDEAEAYRALFWFMEHVHGQLHANFAMRRQQGEADPRMEAPHGHA